MTNLTTIAANRTVDLWWCGLSHAARWRDWSRTDHRQPARQRRAFSYQV